MGVYDVAQLCLNGHLVNDSTQRSPEHNRPHCAKCGEKTITACPACNKPIPGDVHYDGVFGPSSFDKPAFCPSCGKPYPWSARSLDAARELAAEMEGLSDEERTALAGTLDDLLSETPRTQVAATRFKRLLVKAGKGTGEALRKIMVDVMSEAARKTILGP